MLFYVLQLVLIQAVFILFYDRFLRRESLFNWNRWYLLATGLLSFFLPLVKIHWFEKPVFTETLKPVIIGSQSVQTQLSGQITSGHGNLLLYVYVAGVLVMSYWFVYKLYQIFRLTKTNEIIDYQHGIKIVLLQQHREAFTFVNYIFIDKDLYQNQNLPILQHELVHYREKHWLDLLVFEILKILFWFNPFICFYQKRLSAIHEFIADKQVLKQHNFADYFQRLLQEHFASRQVSFINQFYNPSLLKTRIMIQKKNTTIKQTVLKYLSFALILSGLILVVNACNSKTSNKKTESGIEQIDHDTVIHLKNGKKIQVKVVDDEDITNDDDVEVAFQFMKNPPVYPGCESKTGQELKDCMSHKIQKFVMRHFNTEVAKTLGLKGERVKILTMFTIGKDGKVGKIKARSKYRSLEKEAKRVIAMLPQMKPGTQIEKPVAATYTLPIIFKVED